MIDVSVRLREAEQKNLQPETKQPNGFFGVGVLRKEEGENELNKWFHLSGRVMYSCSSKVQIKWLRAAKTLQAFSVSKKKKKKRTLASV